MFTHTTLSFSNMVGPTEQVLFCGNPIVYIAPGTYGHPHVSSVLPRQHIQRSFSCCFIYDSAVPFLPVWLQCVPKLDLNLKNMQYLL